MKMIYGLVAATMLATPALAGSKTVYYPEKYCAEIVSQEYSTGGGDTAIQTLEILCKAEDGTYRGFVTSWGSAAGFFGLGRLAMPDQFIYVPSNEDRLRVN